MKTKRKTIIIVVIILFLIILVLPKINFTTEKDEDKDVKKNAVMLSVDAKIIKPENLQNRIFSNGTLTSNEEVLLRSETSGRVTDISFVEGKRVKQNELLLKINDSELQATLKKNLIKQELASDKEFRARQLLDKNLASQQEYDVALNELNSVKADIEFINAQIAKTEIRAPFDGIIGLRSISIGSYITPQTQIANLQSINPIKIDFAIPQKYYTDVKEGTEINFRLPSLTNIFIGKVYAVEPKIDQTTRTLQSRAIAANSQGLLTPGAYVEIEIVLSNIADAFLIPTDALVPDIQGEKVFVFKKGKAIPQIVQTGIRTEKDIQIISGVEVGDTVIISGIIQLRPNSDVDLNSIK
ncbi:MAG: efflux RND transporter periplasmic adaptor subunit [Ignavibacteriales bacterium]|nr:efflux RND transporter periplasmic adaptor subunit [Ignavibacteriales bacterium]